MEIKYEGASYYGQVKVNSSGDAVRQGLGGLYYSHIRYYEGEWKDGLRHGKGTEHFESQNTYEGDYKEGKAHGQGTYKWRNGEIYKGQWKEGLRHGKGKWKGIAGDSYEGEWINGKAHGYGVHIWKNGDRYEGNWHQSYKHGDGTDTFTNGDKYIGEYSYGKFNGKGCFQWKNGMKYEGEFEAGMRHGQGKWNEKTEGNGDSYEGNYADDKKQGYGVYKWASGNWYQGNFVNDVREGYGEMHWKDGTVYKGEWKGGNQAGYGKKKYKFLGKIKRKGSGYISSDGEIINESNLAKKRLGEQPETIQSNIPIRNRIQIEKNEFSEGATISGRQSKPGSIGIDSPDYEYSNYDSNNEQNMMLQKRYNEILAKRFPNSKSEETTAHQTPIRNVANQRTRKKYSFHIPAHLKSKSKEFLTSNNRDGSKYNLEVISNGKYSVKENQSYSNITKKRMLHSLKGTKGKLNPPSGRIMNPRHAIRANKARYIKDNYSLDNRSGSLPDISRDSTNAVSKNHSKSQLSRMYKMVNKHFGSKNNLNDRSGDESSYGKSTRNSYSKQGHLNSRQILERLQKKKHHHSFGPV